MKKITLNISNRHLHLTAADFTTLFGLGTTPTPLRALHQDIGYAAVETLTLTGPKGQIEKVRLVGPLRDYSQVEVSQTDARTLGIQPPVRVSGDLRGAATVTLHGPAGQLTLPIAIVAARHLHLDPTDLPTFNLHPQQKFSALIGAGGPRPTLFHDFIIRLDAGAKPELHLDTDEANAALAKPGEKITIIPQ